MQNSNKTKQCPRCKKMFECNSSDIAHCACSGLELAEETKRTIAWLYQDCLCVWCMIEMDAILAHTPYFYHASTENFDVNNVKK